MCATRSTLPIQNLIGSVLLADEVPMFGLPRRKDYMIDKLGSFTANFVAELGKKLVEKGLFSDDEMQEILHKAVSKTAQEQQQQKEMKVCNSNYTNIN
tara:strand:+ start:280 stop:573 length:294 start_codon:yes stop_codon:yes gene_type:complete